MEQNAKPLSGVHDDRHELTPHSKEHAVQEAAGALEKLQQDAAATWSRVQSAFSAGMQRLERQAHHGDVPKPPEPPKVDWLVCVDLTTKSFGSGNDIETRLKQLEEVAKQTKDKLGVAIVAQAAVQDVNDESMPLYSMFVENPYHLERYIIRDGKATKMSAMPGSQGYSGDVKELMSFASGRFNADHVSLIIDSHGSGNGGLDADTGHSSVKAFVDAVKSGLKADPKDRSKVDVIDFDACLMSQNEVMNQMRKVTDHVVASPETEGALGQHIMSPISKLIKNPKMTPSEFSELLIDTARLQNVVSQPAREKPTAQWQRELEVRSKSRGDGKTDVPVETLAHIDLKHYEAFRKELDAFGDALTAAIKDPPSRHRVDQLIDSTPSYGHWSVKHDLKRFVEGVLDGIGNGDIADADKQLRLHGGKLLDEFKKLVPSYSGYDSYASLGGLSTFLPERHEVDFHNSARNLSPAYTFQRLVDHPPTLPEKKGEFIEKLNEEIAAMREKQIKPAAEIWSDRPIQQATDACDLASAAVVQLQNASSLPDTLHAMDALRTASRRLTNCRIFDELVTQTERKHKHWVEDHFDSELVKPDSGWGRFREALRRLD